MTTILEVKRNIGNNESQVVKGIYQEANGTYLAVTASRSKTFKSLTAAKRFIGC